MTDSLQPSDEQALQEAADWSLLLGAGEAGESDRQRWQAWLQARPEHQLAWSRIESVTRKFSAVPVEIAAGALQRSAARGRRSRAAPGLLLVLLPVFAALYGVSHNQSAEWAAGPGERSLRVAPDGTQVTLNNAAHVALRYSWRERVLQLQDGELLIETAKDARLWARPFAVETPQGRIEPLGTRFTVRLDGGLARVTVLEGRVRLRPLRPGAATVELDAGTSGSFTADMAPPPRAAAVADAAWLRGLLVAEDQPLCEFLAEVQRYRRGQLFCEASLQKRRISGVFALNDPQQVVDAAARTMDLRVRQESGERLLVAPAR